MGTGPFSNLRRSGMHSSVQSSLMLTGDNWVDGLIFFSFLYLYTGDYVLVCGSNSINIQLTDLISKHVLYLLFL